MTTHDPRASASAEPDLEGRLRALPKAPGPTPSFRDELRVQLVAAAERAPELARSERTAAARAASRRRLRLPFSLPTPGRRAYAIVGAAVAVLLVISGATYLLARRALPGDALYGLKRAGESVNLSTKQGDQSRGDAYLAISTTRIDEAEALVERSTSAGTPGPSHVGTGHLARVPLSPHVDGLVRGVLVAGDTAAVTATRLLTEASVAKRAFQPADTVNGWLADQRSKVQGLVARLPETGAKTAGGAARRLQRDLTAIHARIAALTAGLRCRECRFATSDRFGPLPCRVCPRPPARPTSASQSAPSTSPTSTTSTTSSAQPPSATPTLPPVLPSGTATSTSTAPVPPATTGPTGTSTEPSTGLPPTDTAPPTTSPTTDPPTDPPTTSEPTDGPLTGPTTPTDIPPS